MMPTADLRQPGTQQHPAALPSLSPAADRVLGALLAAFGFALPLSTAGVSIGMALLVAFALVQARPLWRTTPWREPVIALGLVLFAWIAVHTLLTSGLTGRALAAINSYHELVLAAVLLGLMRLTTRRLDFVWGLTAGAVAYAIAHWAAPWVPALAAYLQPRSISAGFVMVLPAFVLLERSMNGSPHAGWLRATAAFLALSVAFTVHGRTGQLMLAMLAMYAAWRWAPRRWRLPAGAALGAVFLIVAFTLGTARERLPEMRAALDRPAGYEQTSTGIRLGLLDSALESARHHGLAGAGFAEFQSQQERSVRAIASRERLDAAFVETLPWLRAENPHNEFLMQLVSGGVVALALFVAWLAAPLLRREPVPQQASLVALTLAFALGCLLNSLLLDFVEAHFHAALLAFLLAPGSAALRPRGGP